MTQKGLNSISMMMKIMTMKPDLHLQTVAALLNRPYDVILQGYSEKDQDIIHLRWFVKTYMNFGWPGGLGPKR